MKLNMKWLFAALAVYLVLLIAKLPAAQLLGRLPLPDNIGLSGVSGSIWQGRAQVLATDMAVVENLEWELAFLPLLLGNLSLDLDAGNSRNSSEIAFNGQISLSMLKPSAIDASDLTLFLPADFVLVQIPLRVPVDAGGRFRVNIEQLAFDQQCVELTGTGQWLNANILGFGDPLQLGNFNADLSCDAGDTIIQVNEPNAFGLSARARVPMDMQISVEGRFKPDPSLPRAVHNAARLYAEPNAQGFYEFGF